MNPETGELRVLTKDQREAWERELGHRVVLLSEDEAQKLEGLSRRKRKGWMRNQPCPCGSKRKFKKCCWHRYT